MRGVLDLDLSKGLGGPAGLCLKFRPRLGLLAGLLGFGQPGRLGSLFAIALLPVHQRGAKHVVQDLVLNAAVRGLHPPQQTAVLQRLDHRLHLGLGRGRIAGQFGQAEGDLCARGRHQPVQKAGGQGLGVRGQPVQRAVQMAAHNRFGPAQFVQGCLTQQKGTPALLLLPQAAHHQLQIGGLNRLPVTLPGAGGFRTATTRHRSAATARHRTSQGHLPAALAAQGHLSAAHLLQHSLHQGFFDRVPGLILPVVLAQRGFHCLLARGPAQVADAQPVVEQKGDAPFEVIQPGQGVVAQADEQIDPQAAVVGNRHQLIAEIRGVALCGRVVIEKIFLELVQNQQQIAADDLRPPLQLGQEGALRWNDAGVGQIGLHRVGDGLGQPPHRLLLPAAEVDGDNLRRLQSHRVGPGPLVELMQHPGPQHGRLAHTAGAIEKGEPGHLQIGRGRGGLPLPAKKVGVVGFGEGGQSPVGGLHRLFPVGGIPAGCVRAVLAHRRASKFCNHSFT